MDVIRLYQDYNIPYREQGHKHCRPGWVQVECPFCRGNIGWHLGYCFDTTSEHHGKYFCWRCGRKRTVDVLVALLRRSETEVKGILAAYGGKTRKTYTPPKKQPAIQPTRSTRLPPGLKPIIEVPGALRYLQSRRFDPEEIASVWGVMASGPTCKIAYGPGKTLDLRYRLIIPVRYRGKTVTWQARDWTGKQQPKYIAAPPEYETIPIKETIYGLDEAEGLDYALLGEGVTDAWRVGPGGVACFGIKYRQKQVRLLASRFDIIIEGFDPEPQAKIQAQEIIRELRQYGVEIHKLPKVPGKDLGERDRKEVREKLWQILTE